MQTTLRLDDEKYRNAKSEAARRGMTLTRYIEAALDAFASKDSVPIDESLATEIRKRNEMMDQLLRRTAAFRIGEKPTRDEINER